MTDPTNPEPSCEELQAEACDLYQCKPDDPHVAAHAFQRGRAFERSQQARRATLPDRPGLWLRRMGGQRNEWKAQDLPDQTTVECMPEGDEWFGPVRIPPVGEKESK
jgi:hypothetical protein